MTTDLVLTTGTTRTGLVLTLVGELDHVSAGQFRAAMDAIELASGHVLTIDLAGLSFCDSTGITALIAARNRIRARGADLILAQVPAPTLRLLQFVGLDQFFRIPPEGEDQGGDE
jgi:anti-sigma B factor antagonist